MFMGNFWGIYRIIYFNKNEHDYTQKVFWSFFDSYCNIPNICVYKR